MTPSEQAKKHGLKSLTEITVITGVLKRTLINWHKNKPKLFECVCVGAAEIKKTGND